MGITQTRHHLLRLTVAVSLILTLLLPFAHRPAAAQAQLGPLYSVGQAPIWVTVDEAANNLFVANYLGADENGSYSSVDLSTGASWALPVRLPQGLVHNDLTRRLYITTGNNTVVVVNSSAPGQVLRTIPVGVTPKWPGLNQRTNRIYVPNHNDHTLSVIDGRTDTVIATIALGNRAPVQAVVDEVANRIYVTSWGTGEILVVDGRSNAVTATMRLSGDPLTGAVHPATGRFFVTYNDAGPSGRVAAFDRSGALVADGRVSRVASGIAFNPVTGLLYVTNGYGSDCDERCRSVSVLDISLNEVGVVHLPFTPGPGIGVDRASGNVYVTSLYSRVEGEPVVGTILPEQPVQPPPAVLPAAPSPATRLPVLSAATWARGYPQRAPNGCVEYVAQWSDGTYTATPWDCPPSVVARRGTLTTTRGYPQLGANGCVEYVTQWSDGSYTWVPFECPTGTVYRKSATS